MKIVLFDMDGTLTPAREKMKPAMVSALSKLQSSGYDIGIVTGSDMNYLTEQCQIIFDDFSFDHTKVHYYPCNGTKYFRYQGQSLVCVYNNDMIKEIGKEKYRLLVSNCINIQKHICETTECPLTGLFFDYRGSMLNWCPIGRLASKEDRLAWEEIDKDDTIRQTWMSHLRNLMKQHGIANVTVKLGGDTSFDIFPTGWDKTYVLKNLSNAFEVNFVGDRCEKNGNDKELYDAIKDMKIGKSFKTSGPKETIEIISSFLTNREEA